MLPLRGLSYDDSVLLLGLIFVMQPFTLRQKYIIFFFGMHGNPRLLFHTSTQTYAVFFYMGNISPHTHTAPSAPMHTNTHVPSPPSHTPATTIHTNTTHTLTHTIRPQSNMEYEKHKLFAALQCINLFHKYH